MLLELLAAGGNARGEDLERALRDESKVVRLAAARIAASGDFGLTEEVVREALLNDEVFNKLDYDETREAQLACFALSDPATILNRIDWWTYEGSHAYRFLALEHFDLISDRVRSDLASDFTALRDESTVRLRERLGDAADRFIADASDDDLEEYKRVLYTEAALEGLAKHGTAADAELGRAYFDHNDADVREAALRVLTALGDTSDIEALQAIANEQSELAGEAARGILRIQPGLNETTRRLLASSSPEVVALALDHLLEPAWTDVAGDVKPLLASRLPAVRTLVADRLGAVLEAGELIAVLDEYLQQRPYFYDAAARLDALLYGPGGALAQE